MSNTTRTCSQFASALLLFVMAWVWLGSVVVSADEPTYKEKSEVRRINALILKAGRLFKSKNYEASQKAVSDAQTRLEKIATGADQELLELLKPEHERLQRAHKLLTEKGQLLADLQPLPEPMSDQKLVSFKDEVAPFLVARCGQCHINRNRGNFSAASYTALGQSTMVAVGIPKDSRIVQVLEEGEMPPDGTVEDAQVEMLKNWIAQGAKFDGDDPAQNLRQLTGAPIQNNVTPAVVTPTGKETVSFGLNVAPILLENCAQCHIDPNNVRGNLSMRNFGLLLRGGDSGSPLTPGSSMDSLIMQRLTAENGANVMPPSGKLDEQKIEIVRRWIDEGATFDGGDAGLETRIVAAKRKADSQDHAELKADRLKRANENWILAMPDIVPDKFESDNFFLFGSNGVDELEALGEIAEKLIPKIQSSLKTNDVPFFKGNSTIFVFERQYDFSEFGTMIVRHPLPKEVDGYWGYTTIDAFSSLLLKRESEPSDVRVSLAQQLAALKVASLSADIPRWFADGVGYWVAARSFPRDEATKTWEQQAATIMARMQQPGDFLEGKLPEHQAALVAYMFVKQLRSDSGRFAKLLNLLQDQQPFEQSFTLAYGATPKSMFDSGARRNRSGPRRNGN